MSYSLSHYLRNFPIRYYLAGGLISRDEPRVLFFLSADAASVLLVRRGRCIAYENNIDEVVDHPPIPGIGATPSSVARAFTAKLFARNRVHGSPRMILVPDFGAEDLYCNVHSARNLRDYSIEELLDSLHEEPRQVIGAWDDAREFCWSVLGANLQEVSGRIDRQHSRLMIIGIPRQYCDECELWTEAQQGSLLGIIPVPVACLRWFIETIPLEGRLGFVVLALAQAIVVAAVQDQAITLIRQYESDFEFVEKELTTIAAELGSNQPPYICVWSAGDSPAHLATRLRGLVLDQEALEKIHGSSILIRHPSRTRQLVRDPKAYLLMWLESQMI
jgi:hypothetical protein